MKSHFRRIDLAADTCTGGIPERIAGHENHDPAALQRAYPFDKRIERRRPGDSFDTRNPGKHMMTIAADDDLGRLDNRPGQRVQAVQAVFSDSDNM